MGYAGWIIFRRRGGLDWESPDFGDRASTRNCGGGGNGGWIPESDMGNGV